MTRLRIWDAKTGVHLATLKGHLNTVYSVAFSPDGSHIASGSHDQTVRIWDTKTGVHLTTLNGHSDRVYSVAFSPDGSRIVGFNEKTTRIWDAKTGSYLSTVKYHSNTSLSTLFPPKTTNITSHKQSAVRPCSHKIQLQSPGWLVISGDVNTRCWLPAGTYSRYHQHSSYGNSVVVGTQEGLMVLLDMSLATVN
jgi:WD40 repeat protein